MSTKSWLLCLSKCLCLFGNGAYISWMEITCYNQLPYIKKETVNAYTLYYKLILIKQNESLRGSD